MNFKDINKLVEEISETKTPISKGFVHKHRFAKVEKSDSSSLMAEDTNKLVSEITGSSLYKDGKHDPALFTESIASKLGISDVRISTQLTEAKSVDGAVDEYSKDVADELVTLLKRNKKLKGINIFMNSNVEFKFKEGTYQIYIVPAKNDKVEVSVRSFGKNDTKVDKLFTQDLNGKRYDATKMLYNDLAMKLAKHVGLAVQEAIVDMSEAFLPADGEKREMAPSKKASSGLKITPQQIKAAREKAFQKYPDDTIMMTGEIFKIFTREYKLDQKEIDQALKVLKSGKFESKTESKVSYEDEVINSINLNDWEEIVGSEYKGKSTPDFIIDGVKYRVTGKTVGDMAEVQMVESNESDEDNSHNIEMLLSNIKSVAYTLGSTEPNENDHKKAQITYSRLAKEAKAAGAAEAQIQIAKDAGFKKGQKESSLKFDERNKSVNESGSGLIKSFEELRDLAVKAKQERLSGSINAAQTIEDQIEGRASRLKRSGTSKDMLEDFLTELAIGDEDVYSIKTLNIKDWIDTWMEDNGEQNESINEASEFKSNNESFGFYGTIISNFGLSTKDADACFDKMGKRISKESGLPADKVVDALDSKYGRHFADYLTFKDPKDCSKAIQMLSSADIQKQLLGPLGHKIKESRCSYKEDYPSSKSQEFKSGDPVIPKGKTSHSLPKPMKFSHVDEDGMAIVQDKNGKEQAFHPSQLKQVTDMRMHEAQEGVPSNVAIVIDALDKSGIDSDFDDDDENPSSYTIRVINPFHKENIGDEEKADGKKPITNKEFLGQVKKALDKYDDELSDLCEYVADEEVPGIEILVPNLGE